MTPKKGAPASVLVPVLCPACGRELSVDRGDRIALCLTCRKATFLSRDLPTYDLSYVVPPSGSRKADRYVPFWRVEGEATILADEKKARLYAGIKRLGDLYYPAFWLPRIQHFQDFTMRYALLDGPLETEPREDPVPGGIRSPEMLRAMARLTWLTHLDRVEDVSGVDVRYEVKRITLAAVPFFRESNAWLDGICLSKLPPNLF